MDTSKYQELFISEAEEYLEQISDSILELERNPGNMDAVNNMFRGLHTIKGMAASMGYGEIAKIAHQLEDVADLIRNNKIKLYKELINNSWYLEVSITLYVQNPFNAFQYP